MRPDLQPYVDHPTELVKGSVWVRLREYQGGDGTLNDLARAVLGTKFKSVTERDIIRYCLRHEIEQPFRHVTACFEIVIPEPLRREFQVLGRWVWDDRAGDPYAYPLGRTQAFGIWTIDLWDALLLMERWAQYRQPPELRYIARHLSTIVRKWTPLAFDAYQDYVLHGARLSQIEINVLRDVFEELIVHKAGDYDLEKWWRDHLVRRNIYGEEQEEFLAKLDLKLWGRRSRPT